VRHQVAADHRETGKRSGEAQMAGAVRVLNPILEHEVLPRLKTKQAMETSMIEALVA
jgi:hypothetical protein